MPIFQVYDSITSVYGWQCWKIEADNEEEAKQKVSEGEVDFVDQEIEVQDSEFDSIVRVE